MTEETRERRAKEYGELYDLFHTKMRRVIGGSEFTINGVLHLAKGDNFVRTYDDPEVKAQIDSGAKRLSDYIATLNAAFNEISYITSQYPFADISKKFSISPQQRVVDSTRRAQQLLAGLALKWPVPDWTIDYANGIGMTELRNNEDELRSWIDDKEKWLADKMQNSVP